MKSHIKNQLALSLAVIAALLCGWVRADQMAVAFDTTQWWSMQGASGVFGWQFTTRSDIQITALGIYDNPGVSGGGYPGDGLLESHDIAVWDVSSHVSPVVSALIPSGIDASLVSGFRWVNIPQVTLLAGHDYVIAALYSNTDLRDLVTGAINNPGFVLTASHDIQFGGYRAAGYPFLAFPEYYAPGAQFAFGPNFLYTIVAECPRVVAQPQTQTAEAGSVPCFSVRANGGRPLCYQWFFNGTNVIRGATNSILQLCADQPEQSGLYSVVITNCYAGATSTPATLNVIAPIARKTVPALTLMGQTGSFLNLDHRGTPDSSANWQTFDTVSVTSSVQSYFDLTLPLASQRFYRASQTNVLSPPSIRDVHLVPAITLTGAIGTSVRIDYINQFGPVEAWVTLATVTLTNTTQLYFDTSSIGQPPRLWRLVLSP